MDRVARSPIASSTPSARAIATARPANRPAIASSPEASPIIASGPSSNSQSPTSSPRSARTSATLGTDPVASNPPSSPSRPRNRYRGETTGSPRCVPSTAAISQTTLRPSRRRASWTTTSIAEATWFRMCAAGSSTSDIIAIVSRRQSRCRHEFAWAVDREPSCPVFIAWSMSRASPPRTSPTMIRSGRIRRALRTRSRTVTCPLPSTLGGRASSATTCDLCKRSSAASSIVISRSSSGMNADRIPRRVVLPLPAPPLTTTFARPRTHAERNRMPRGPMLPWRTMSSPESGIGANVLIVSTGPRSERGGTIACTLLPPGSRASTQGDAWSTRRPRGPTMRSIRCRTDSSPSNSRSSTLSIRPSRST